MLDSTDSGPQGRLAIVDESAEVILEEERDRMDYLEAGKNKDDKEEKSQVKISKLESDLCSSDSEL